jgi:hypothetical protein
MTVAAAGEAAPVDLLIGQEAVDGDRQRPRLEAGDDEREEKVVPPERKRVQPPRT